MKRISVCLLLIFVFIFRLAIHVCAVSIAVTDIPSSISKDPFTVTVSVLGANAGKNYLRIDLFKDGTSNYFGETFNGNEWYYGSTGTSYFPIDIISSSSSVSATIQSQIGEPTSTEYSGSGPYKLRIRRYTSATGYSTSSPYDIIINVPTPTSTMTPSPTPSNTPTPTNAPTPTKVSTQTPIPTTKRTPTPSLFVSVSPSIMTDREASSSSSVLGAWYSEGESAHEASTSGGTYMLKPIIISLLFISTGFALLAGVFVWQKNGILK